MLKALAKKMYSLIYNENSYSFMAELSVENQWGAFFAKLSQPHLRSFRIKAIVGSSPKEVGSFSLVEVEPNRFLIRNFHYDELYPDVKKAMFRFIDDFTGQELIKCTTKENPL